MQRNYSSTTPGTVYVRAPHIDIDYAPSGEATIRVIEAEAIKLADGSVRELGHVGQLGWTVGPADMSRVLQLRDPTTGAVIPGATMTRQQLMLGLLADIREHQLERDAAEAAAAAATTPPEA